MFWLCSDPVYKGDTLYWDSGCGWEELVVHSMKYCEDGNNEIWDDKGFVRKSSLRVKKPSVIVHSDGWINILENGKTSTIYTTKVEAIDAHNEFFDGKKLDTVKVCWSEEK
jgi:hypothetical protein